MINILLFGIAVCSRFPGLRIYEFTKSILLYYHENKNRRVCKLAIGAMLFILTKQSNIIFYILADRYYSRPFHTAADTLVLFFSFEKKTSKKKEEKKIDLAR